MQTCGPDTWWVQALVEAAAGVAVGMRHAAARAVVSNMIRFMPCPTRAASGAGRQGRHGHSSGGHRRTARLVSAQLSGPAVRWYEEGRMYALQQRGGVLHGE